MEKTRNLKIATIEDSTVVADRLRRLINEITGYHYAGNAAGVDEAVALIAAENPDVLIVDLHLGHTAAQAGGLRLLLHLQSRAYKGIIIVYSNLSTREYRDKCFQLGAHYFFDKIGEYDLLVKGLTEIISR